jgi:translation elongation factor P/translation initiation factor 5A
MIKTLNCVKNSLENGREIHHQFNIGDKVNTIKVDKIEMELSNENEVYAKLFKSNTFHFIPIKTLKNK